MGKSNFLVCVFDQVGMDQLCKVWFGYEVRVLVFDLRCQWCCIKNVVNIFVSIDFGLYCGYYVVEYVDNFGNV